MGFRKLNMPREFYIPKGAVKVADKASDAVAYLYPIKRADGALRFGGLGFAGKAAKPAWHFTFGSEERRAKHVTEFFAGQRATLERRAKRQEERKSAPRGLEVGDVLRSSWGYEQTNVDFYEVTAVVGARMVELRPIAQQLKETGFMSGKCAPVPGEFTGPAFRAMAREGRVKIGHHSASKMTPQIVAGVPLYEAAYTSWYG